MVRHCRDVPGALTLLAASLMLTLGCARDHKVAPPDILGQLAPFEEHVLELDSWWILEHPHGRQFDASGIARLDDGRFLFVNDKENAILSAIVEGPTGAVVRVEEFVQIRRGGRRASRLDLEGLTIDRDGRVYVCAEVGRRIFRVNPADRSVEEIEIDWSAVDEFFGADANASLEGIAASDLSLYVVNERSQPRIIEIDPRRGAAVDSFVVSPPGSASWVLHYSGIEFHRGAMFVLLRFHKTVLEIDPVRRRVVAAYDYGAIEGSRELAFRSGSLTGFMEGVWVDDDFIWLLVDNNGQSSYARRGDIRPILIRCRRP